MLAVRRCTPHMEEVMITMRNSGVGGAVVLAAILGYGCVAFCQSQSTPPKPGLEVPLVTPGPGWKACPRCMNDGHAAAARAKANVETREFDPHDISGIWSGTLEDLGVGLEYAF